MMKMQMRHVTAHPEMGSLVTEARMVTMPFLDLREDALGKTIFVALWGVESRPVMFLRVTFMDEVSPMSWLASRSLV